MNELINLCLFSIKRLICSLYPGFLREWNDTQDVWEGWIVSHQFCTIVDHSPRNSLRRRLRQTFPPLLSPCLLIHRGFWYFPWLNDFASLRWKFYRQPEVARLRWRQNTRLVDDVDGDRVKSGILSYMTEWKFLDNLFLGKGDLCGSHSSSVAKWFVRFAMLIIYFQEVTWAADCRQLV